MVILDPAVVFPELFIVRLWEIIHRKIAKVKWWK